VRVRDRHHHQDDHLLPTGPGVLSGAPRHRHGQVAVVDGRQHRTGLVRPAPRRVWLCMPASPLLINGHVRPKSDRSSRRLPRRWPARSACRVRHGPTRRRGIAGRVDLHASAVGRDQPDVADGPSHGASSTAWPSAVARQPIVSSRRRAIELLANVATRASFPLTTRVSSATAGRRGNNAGAPPGPLPEGAAVPIGIDRTKLTSHRGRSTPLSANRYSSGGVSNLGPPQCHLIDVS
jgi:hypothetical protein